MSGKSTVAVTAVSQTAVSQSVGSRAAASKPDASARWAALDSRHERLVTASDALLANLGREDDRRKAS